MCTTIYTILILHTIPQPHSICIYIHIDTSLKKFSACFIISRYYLSYYLSFGLFLYRNIATFATYVPFLLLSFSNKAHGMCMEWIYGAHNYVLVAFMELFFILLYKLDNTVTYENVSACLLALFTYLCYFHILFAQNSIKMPARYSKSLLRELLFM